MAGPVRGRVARPEPRFKLDVPEDGKGVQPSFDHWPYQFTDWDWDSIGADDYPRSDSAVTVIDWCTDQFGPAGADVTNVSVSEQSNLNALFEKLDPVKVRWFQGYRNHFAFRDAADAMLFRLRWC